MSKRHASRTNSTSKVHVERELAHLPKILDRTLPYHSESASATTNKSILRYDEGRHSKRQSGRAAPLLSALPRLRCKSRSPDSRVRLDAATQCARRAKRDFGTQQQQPKTSPSRQAATGLNDVNVKPGNSTYSNDQRSSPSHLCCSDRPSCTGACGRHGISTDFPQMFITACASEQDRSAAPQLSLFQFHHVRLLDVPGTANEQQMVRKVAEASANFAAQLPSPTAPSHRRHAPCKVSTHRGKHEAPGNVTRADRDRTNGARHHKQNNATTRTIQSENNDGANEVNVGGSTDTRQPADLILPSNNPHGRSSRWDSSPSAAHVIGSADTEAVTKSEHVILPAVKGVKPSITQTRSDQ